MHGCPHEPSAAGGLALTFQHLYARPARALRRLPEICDVVSSEVVHQDCVFYVRAAGIV